MLAPTGHLFEAFEGTLSSRVAKRQWDVAPSSDAELCSEDVRMSLGRSRGDPKTLGNLNVRAPLCDELDHLPLAGSELILFGHGRVRCWHRETRLPIDRVAYLSCLHPSIYKRRRVAARIYCLHDAGFQRPHP